VGAKGAVEAKTCGSTDKISAIGADGIPVCTADQTGTAGSGITSLNGSSQSTQSFVDGTNIHVSTNAGTGAHTIGLTGPVASSLGGTGANNTGAAGKVLMGNGSGQFVEGDPLVQGLTAHDAVGTSTNPVAMGGYASTAVPADVSADGDIVRAWLLRSGAQAVQLTHNGSLYKPTTPTDTQPISVSSLPLPAGASTSAKQPALGTAGSPASDVITVQGVASMTALKVDGSAVTQPVSAASLPLPAGASTSAKQPSLGTAGSPATDVITVQGIASMTPLKVDGSAVTQPVSGTVSTTPPANASANVAQVGGTATDTNSGNKSAGTLRVVIATDQPQLTNALKVDGSAVTQPVSIAATVTTQDTSTGATGSAVPARAQLLGGTDGSNLVATYIDPCQRGVKTYYPVNISTATTVRFASPVASKKTFICSIVLVAGAADNFNIIEGTGGTCGTATAGVLGGTTAAAGINAAANGGFTAGNGSGAIAATAGTNVDACLITSAAVQLSGHITFVQF
jgi:hypothetical protein